MNKTTTIANGSATDSRVQLLLNYDPHKPPNFDGLEIDAWKKVCSTLVHSLQVTPWLLGDVFNAGKKFVPNADTLDGDELLLKIARIFPTYGLEEFKIKTIWNWAAVARTFPPDQRIPGVKWEHYRETMVLPDHDERLAWLRKAAEHNWSVKQLRIEALAVHRSGDDPEPPAPWFSVAAIALDLARWTRQSAPDGKPHWTTIRAVQSEFRPAVPALAVWGIKVTFEEPTDPDESD